MVGVKRMKLIDQLRALKDFFKITSEYNDIVNGVRSMVQRYEYLKVRTEIFKQKLDTLEIKDDFDKVIKEELQDELKNMMKEMVRIEASISKIKEILRRVDE